MGFRSAILRSTRQVSLLFLREFHREGAVWTGKAPSGQGRRRLDREGRAPSRRHRALKNAILRCPGLRCRGFRAPSENDDRDS